MATAFKCSLDLPLQDFEGGVGLVELISQFAAFFGTLAYCFAKAGVTGPVQKCVQKSLSGSPVYPKAISIFLMHITFKQLLCVFSAIRQIMR